MTFVHLHTHSHYSIGRAVPSVRQLVERAAQLHMPAIALTDHNSLAGLNELDQAATEFGIQPILGCELDMLPSDHGVYQGRTHRLVLLAATEEGYRNLVALVTHAHEAPADQPPHVAFTDFERRCQGLIVLSGSRRSELYHLLRERKTGPTKNYLNRLAGAVGQENLYFEVIEYPHPRTRRIMDYITELSHFLKVPAVATQNVHFLDPDDMPAYCALVQFPRLLAPEWPLPDTEMPTRHFTTEQEMQRRFAFTPELLEETGRLAERCTFRFPRRQSRLPVPDFERGRDAPSVLWDAAVRGASHRYSSFSEMVKERLNEEYRDICSTDARSVDLAAYLLVLHEITAALRDLGVCRGVGRGPLVASVTAYALGITEIDPLLYELPYQPLRPTPDLYPPFQIDISTRGMEEALHMLAKRYGERNVAAVGHRVDWQRQVLFERLSRWAGLPVASLRKFPPAGGDSPRGRTAAARASRGAASADEEAGGDASESAGQPPVWDEEQEEVATAEAPEHSAWVQDPRIPRQKSLLRHENLASATYTLHPCPRAFEAERGHYALSREPFDTLVVALPARVGSRVTQAPEEFLDRPRITQAPEEFLDRLQTPRIQFTSFPMLNILEKAVACIRQERDRDFSLFEIQLNDDTTYRLLGLGLTNGITPLHRITAKSLLRSEAPRSIRELARVLTLAGKRRLTEEAEDRRADQLTALPDCVLSYWCAYIKAHHPVSFMTAMLTHSMSARAGKDQRPRFQILLRETRKMNIEVLGPDINFSDYEFTQDQLRIRTGLMVVQGMGQRTYGEIQTVRYGRMFSSLSDFCQRTDPRQVSHAAIVNLIKAGAFDGLANDRGALLDDFERALKNLRLRSAHAVAAAPAKAGAPANTGLEQLLLFDPEAFEEPPTSRETARHPAIVSAPSDIMRYEQEAVGYPITYDLLDRYEELMNVMGAVSPFKLGDLADGKTVLIAGFIDHVERDGPLVDSETDLVLDLEGFVVKVPAELRDAVGRVQNARGPVLVDGIVRKHSKTEQFLVACGIRLLEDVEARAEQVTELRLNLEGQNGKRLGAIRSLLKTYKGKTLVTLEGDQRMTWWESRGIEGARVFFCPPLSAGLTRLLPETRIRALDAKGQPVRF